MKKATFQFEFKDLKLSVPQIEHVMGYKKGEDRELVSDLIAEILNEAEEFCDIRAEYIIYKNIKFNNADKSIKINDLGFQVKKIIFRQIKKSDSIAVFLCTAGEEIGIKSRKAMQEKDLLRGYIYDVVGSEAAEAAADIMQRELERTMSLSGGKITNRYSPGYCGWDVSEQHKLFQLIPDSFCGIRLTESALMNPVKSVSGIIGLGSDVKRNPYTCNLCDMKDCIYRRIREKIV
ncbi:MAG TPA: vitamin B12 dependent-methionine synthase activation domain-containing protein [Bacteroidales bacterium]|nr:vitamin B12 dependent-methionine synthase activation domain-containing protein [Bacteroidales bacterium]